MVWLQRFQKLYEAAEKEASIEKRQLTLLHQQRVQADMNDRKRRLLQKYVEAVDFDEENLEVSLVFSNLYLKCVRHTCNTMSVNMSV